MDHLKAITVPLVEVGPRSAFTVKARDQSPLKSSKLMVLLGLGCEREESQYSCHHKTFTRIAHETEHYCPCIPENYPHFSKKRITSAGT
jgi:hypothetical protein